MNLSHGRAQTLILLFGLGLSSQFSLATQQTTPFLAVHATPQYSHLKVMPYANANAPKGGMLSQSSNGTFDNLNSMNGKGSSTDGVNYLFDTLMDSSLDEPNVMYPLLAERATYDPHKPKFVIFYLNPKARFSNGDVLTADDVKFTFDTYQEKANPGLKMYLSDLEKTEVLSKYQVKFTFKSDDNAEMPLIVASLPIYSKQEWQNRDFTRVTMQPILGSGPYLIDRIDAGRSITYKRNPNYWAKDLPVNRGRYNFDRLRYVYYRNLDVTFEGFKSGQFTLQEENISRRWVTEYKFPAVRDGLVKKYKVNLAKPLDFQSFVFNTRRKPFDDINLRKALSYAYDFEWQNKALFYGQYQRLQSYFANSELAAVGRPSAAEMSVINPYLSKLNPLMQKGVLADWKFPASDASGFNRQNLLSARQILQDAGYTVKNGRLLDRQAKPIEIELLIHQDGMQRTLMPFVRNLKRLGITVTIRHVDVPQYIERMRRSDFDITTMRLPQTITPGKEQAQLWGTKAADEEGNYNFAGIKNPAIDQVIQKIIAAESREQVVLHTRVLDRLLRAGYYHIPTYGKPETWLAYWDMYQQPTQKPKLSIGVDYWWVDTEKAKKVSQYLRKK